MDIKELITSSRIAKKWTQKEVAERAKVTLASVRRMENGGSVVLSDLERVLLIVNYKAYQKLEASLRFDAQDLFSDPVKQFEFMDKRLQTKRIRKHAKG
jgi:transcriptional regulator with XRE-family HTH domain